LREVENNTKDIILKTLVVTPSGALSPGLLSASAVAAGLVSGPLGGLAVAFGHMAFELPYVFLLSKAIGKVRGHLERFKKVLGLVVFLFTLFFAQGLLTSAGMPNVNVSDALLAGFVFTASNFYFLLWWATVGIPLIEMASESTKNFAIMYLSHVWMDYAWLALLAGLGRAMTLLGGAVYLNVALAILLMVFGVDVLLKSFVGKGILP